MRCSAQLIHVYRLFVYQPCPTALTILNAPLSHLSFWPCWRLLLHIISLPTSCHPYFHGDCISETPSIPLWQHILKSLLFEPPQAVTSEVMPRWPLFEALGPYSTAAGLDRAKAPLSSCFPKERAGSGQMFARFAANLEEFSFSGGSWGLLPCDALPSPSPGL